MSDVPVGPATFSYRARAADGQSITGTIDAANLGAARQRLAGLSLSVDQLSPVPISKPARAMGSGDFLAFNQQLAQLTGAGMPIEAGLRLIAADFHRGPLRRAIDAVASDLESGKTLPQAIEAHRTQFPPLYSKLIDAGIRGGNLSGILLNLGRHLSLMRRLQSALWRTFAYPAAVVLIFIPVYVIVLHVMLPQYKELISSSGQVLRYVPAGNRSVWSGIAEIVLDLLGPIASISVASILGVMAGMVVLLIVVIQFVRARTALSERILFAVPVIGSIARDNLIARWCDAVGIGVAAGIDLPSAIALADDAIVSPGLHRDSQAIIAALSAGRLVSDAGALRIIPPIATISVDAASQRADLPQTLQLLSQLYQQQAETRLASAPAILTPVVLIIIGSGIALLAIAVIAPLLSLINSMMGWY